MKPSFLYLVILHALVVVLFFGLWRSCDKNKTHVCDNTEVIKTTIEYITDSIPYEAIIKAPKQPKEIIEVEVPADVDTAKILAKYYAKNIYERHYEDSNIKVTLKDTVSENNLSDASLTYKLLRETKIIINNELKLKPINKYFLGGTIHGDTSVSVAINMFMLTKKETLIGVGYDPFKNTASVTGAIRIFKGSLRRKK